MEKPNYTLEELKAEPHYSYSALNTYLNICPLQYFYRYIEKREPERTPIALPFGSAFHSVVSEIASYAKKGELPKAETMKDAFAEYFKGFCNTSVDVTYKKDETENDLLETAGRMIDTALRDWPDFWNIEAVALPFRVEVEGLSRPLIGELDMVIDNSTPFDDTPVPPLIVDFKTAARSWPEDKPDHDLQASANGQSAQANEQSFGMKIPALMALSAMCSVFSIRMRLSSERSVIRRCTFGVLVLVTTSNRKSGRLP